MQGIRNEDFKKRDYKNLWMTEPAPFVTGYPEAPS